MKAPEPKEIASLLQRIQQRDQAAFRSLYEMFSRRVYAFLMHRFRDESLAEEVVSDTLLHVWRSPAAFRGDSSFSTWLLGVARYKGMEKLRALASVPPADDIGEVDESLFVEETGPEQVAMMRQRSEGVRQCLEQLPVAQRECMHLAYYEGWTLDEIGELLQTKRETIGTRLHYARKKIQACLAALLAREGLSTPMRS